MRVARSDVTIVNVALPSIERDLGANFSDLEWVIDAYALTLAAFVLAAESLGDMVGRRLIFILGLAERCMAAVGSVAGYALVRPRDFVAAGSPAPAPPGPGRAAPA